MSLLRFMEGVDPKLLERLERELKEKKRREKGEEFDKSRVIRIGDVESTKQYDKWGKALLRTEVYWNPFKGPSKHYGLIMVSHVLVSRVKRDEKGRIVKVIDEDALWPESIRHLNIEGAKKHICHLVFAIAMLTNRTWKDVVDEIARMIYEGQVKPPKTAIFI